MTVVIWEDWLALFSSSDSISHTTTSAGACSTDPAHDPDDHDEQVRSWQENNRRSIDDDGVVHGVRHHSLRRSKSMHERGVRLSRWSESGSCMAIHWGSTKIGAAVGRSVLKVAKLYTVRWRLLGNATPERHIYPQPWALCPLELLP